MELKKIFERPEVYALAQRLNPFTVSRIRDLAVRNVPNSAGLAVLDVGCGVGSYRSVFNQTDYIGVDVNQAYIEFAKHRYSDAKFYVMGADTLNFPDQRFDAVLSTGMTHHLDDRVLGAMVRTSLRIVKETGALHIVDAILPVSRRSIFKRWFFLQDRGRNQRTLAGMTSILSANANLTRVDVLTGPLHDVAYFRLQHRLPGSRELEIPTGS